MKALVKADPKDDFDAYLKELEREQFDDGVTGHGAKKATPTAAAEKKPENVAQASK
jgi:hypothetical protein